MIVAASQPQGCTRTSDLVGGPLFQTRRGIGGKGIEGKATRKGRLGNEKLGDIPTNPQQVERVPSPTGTGPAPARPVLPYPLAKSSNCVCFPSFATTHPRWGNATCPSAVATGMAPGQFHSRQAAGLAPSCNLSIHWSLLYIGTRADMCISPTRCVIQYFGIVECATASRAASWAGQDGLLLNPSRTILISRVISDINSASSDSQHPFAYLASWSRKPADRRGCITGHGVVHQPCHHSLGQGLMTVTE